MTLSPDGRTSVVLVDPAGPSLLDYARTGAPSPALTVEQPEPPFALQRHNMVRPFS